MKRFTIASLLIGSSLMAAMGANMPSFNDFDTNKDGKITQQEFESTQQARMQQKAESGKMMKNAANAPAFSDIDTNGDGAISKDEFANHQKNNMMNKRSQMGQGMRQGQNN